MKRYLTFFILVTFSLSYGLSIQAAEDIPPERVIYSFLQGFPTAQTLWLSEETRIQGTWTGDRFHFEGLPGAMEIFITDAAQVGGKTHAAIWIQPVGDMEAILTFPNVPPGRKLRLFFAAPDIVFQQGKINPIYLEVWIGRKRLFEARIHTKGWKEKTLDLLLPFLLQRLYQIRVRVRAHEKNLSSLVFYGRIE